MGRGNQQKSLLNKVAWRVSKASLIGLATFLVVYLIPTMLFPISILPPVYEPLFYLFVAITVFFAVAIELFSETLIHYALKIARTVVLISFFVYCFSGGILAVDVETVHLVVDLRVLLDLLILINIIALVNSILGAVNFLSEQNELPKRIS